MNITLMQTSPVWADPVANALNVYEAARELEGTDLIILPEMFTTGFVTEPEGKAEPFDGPGLPAMKRIAAEKDCAVAGSIATQESDGSYRNRFHFIFPDGQDAVYDKRHLFSYGGEHLRYTRGEKRTIVEYKGVRILPQICYDLRFPVFARNGLRSGRPDYDLIIYVASWPSSRIEAWDTLLKARAIENQCYVAAVNRVGTDPYNRYPGHSMIVSPYGRILANCKENEVMSINTEINFQELADFRKSFPVLADADF